MKIACFFSDSTWASWSLSQGLPEVIKRMGHECFAGALPPDTKMTKARRDSLPTQEQLESCDLIIICGAEYLKGWIEFLYPDWKKLKAKKCGWFHESIDYALKKGIIYESILKYIDVPFLPNPQDAEYKKAAWLPIGVDTEMFKPCGVTLPKPVEIGFTGLLYDKRAQFLSGLVPHVGDLEIRIGNVQLLGADTDAHLFRRQTELLAKNYREMEILFNLPSLSNVLVMKILEAMAVGTFVCTPEMDSLLHEKLALEDGKDLVFYQPDKPQQVADALKYFVEHDGEREKIAKRGCKTVREKFRMEDRLQSMIGAV